MSRRKPPSVPAGKTNPFDASASLLGYLFQCRLGLADAVRRLRRGDMFMLSIETLDDVVFETVGSATELLQTKHHLKAQGGLGDASVDMWSSLRVWIEGRVAGRIPPDAVLYLLSTGGASEGTAAAYLRADAARDITKARERLDGVAQTSPNKDNAPAYSQYNALTLDDRTSLLENVVVIDRHPDIAGLEGTLKEALNLTVERGFLDALVPRLEGWWFQRVISSLLRREGSSILSEELEAEIDRLRNQFRPNNLPIDDDLLDVEIDEQAFADHFFVEQLRLIKISNARILNAMRQYFRAFEQRSRWLRDGFLVVGELDRYDRRLIEEWEIHFNVMKDELGEKAAEAAMKMAAHKLYGWAEAEASLLVRPACAEPFVTRGSLQLLADKSKVGWHPQFLSRLQHLLSEEAV